MKAKGFLLIFIAAVVVIVAIVVVFLVPSIRGRVNFKNTIRTTTKSCTLALDEKFLPESIGDYKLVERRPITENAAYAVYSNGETPTDNLKISDKISLIITKEGYLYGGDDPKQGDPVAKEKLRKALRNELTNKEFEELVEFWKSKKFIAQRETISGINVLIFEAQTRIEGLPYSLQYTDKNSGLTLYMGFGKKVENYQYYFENWYQQVCG